MSAAPDPTASRGWRFPALRRQVARFIARYYGVDLSFGRQFLIVFAARNV